MLDSAAKVFFNLSTYKRLWGGLLVTIEFSAASILLSMIFGLIVGMLMLSPKRFWRITTRWYLEIIRLIPILTFLFLFYFLLSRTLQVNLDARIVAILTFTLWGTAEMADLVRGALSSVPAHQLESGLAIGLTTKQVNLKIILPQAVRHLMPGVINLTTRMIKTTPLIYFINIPELITIGRQMVETAVITQHNRMANFWIYGLVFVIYFLVCFPISRFSKYLETKWQS